MNHEKKQNKENMKKVAYSLDFWVQVYKDLVWYQSEYYLCYANTQFSSNWARREFRKECFRLKRKFLNNTKDVTCSFWIKCADNLMLGYWRNEGELLFLADDYRDRFGNKLDSRQIRLLFLEWVINKLKQEITNPA